MVRSRRAWVPLWAIGFVVSIPEQVGGAAADRSRSAQVIGQVRSTVEDLLQSLQDEAEHAAQMKQHRDKWCSEAIGNLTAEVKASNATMMLLQANLEQHQAAAEAAQGIAEQLRADIAAANDSLNRLQKWTVQVQSNGNANDLRMLRSAADSKRQALASLQAELQIVLPSLYQVQAHVAEAQCRIGDRQDSAASAVALIEASHQDCDAATKRAEQADRARKADVDSIASSLKGLGSLGASPSQLRGSGGASDAANFLQIGSESGSDADLADGLSSLLPPSPPSSMPSHPSQRRSRRKHARKKAALFGAAKMAMREAVSAAPRVSEMLTQLRNMRDLHQQRDGHENEWCVHTKREHELVVRQAEDSISMLSTMVEVHGATAVALKEDLSGLNTVLAHLNSTKVTAQELADEEMKFFEGVVRNRKLASKILRQALSILAKTSKADVAHGSNATVALRSTKGLLERQLKAWEMGREDQHKSLKLLLDSFDNAFHAHEQERTSIEYLHGEHLAQKAQGADSRLAYEAEVHEEQSFVQKIAKECSSSSQTVRDQELRAEVHALTDAQNALEGRRLPDASSGAVSSSVPSDSNERPMSPLERAALALGVPLPSDH